MAININNFMESFTRWMASGAGLSWTATPRAIWREHLREGADPVSVVRQTPGPAMAFDPMPRVSCQVETLGTAADATRARAQLLFEACLDGASLPRRMTTINGFTTAGVADGTWRLVSIDPIDRPALVEYVDGKWKVVFNLEVGFVKRT